MDGKIGCDMLCATGSQEGSSLGGTTKPTSMKIFFKSCNCKVPTPGTIIKKCQYY